MVRYIEYDKIKEASSLIQTEINNILAEQIQLVKDINSVKESYKGIDADQIVSKYLDYANEVVDTMSVIQSYNNYFDWLSEAYKSSHESFNNSVILEKKGDEKII